MSSEFLSDHSGTYVSVILCDLYVMICDFDVMWSGVPEAARVACFARRLLALYSESPKSGLMVSSIA